MSAKTLKLVSPERVRRILECYGANPDSWPMDEKVAALSLIQNSNELQALQQEAAEFDKLLKDTESEFVSDEATTRSLVDRVVSALPEQDSKSNPDFVNLQSGGHKSFFDLNRTLGAIAASIAVVAISLSIATITPDSAKPVSIATTSQSELDVWMWEQVVGDTTDEIEEPLSMMALLDLEEL